MQAKFYYKDLSVFVGKDYYAPHYRNSSKILHREDGPAAESSDGTKEWYLNGYLHREDGPAIELSDGTKEWYLNGQRHREDGPATELADGTKAWYLNGKLHREDGPAVEWCDGTKEWFLNGKELKILSKEYLIRYMELTGECLASLLLSPDEMLRESTKKYEWKEIDGREE